AYAKKYGVSDEQLKEVMTRIAWKNHKNGALNPRAQFRKEVPKGTIACSPLVAGALGIFDCSGVSDGSAAAIIVRADDAHRYTDKPLYVKALSFVAGPGAGPIDPDYDYTTFNEVVASAADAYAQAGIKEPRQELAMAEVHDCFTPTELVLMEDLGFAARGTAWKEVLAGTFDLEGELAVDPDGGLKSFGHPSVASGRRGRRRDGARVPARRQRRRVLHGLRPQSARPGLLRGREEHEAHPADQRRLQHDRSRGGAAGAGARSQQWWRQLRRRRRARGDADPGHAQEAALAAQQRDGGQVARGRLCRDAALRAGRQYGLHRWSRQHRQEGRAAATRLRLQDRLLRHHPAARARRRRTRRALRPAR